MLRPPMYTLLGLFLFLTSCAPSGFEKNYRGASLTPSQDAAVQYTAVQNSAIQNIGMQSCTEPIVETLPPAMTLAQAQHSKPDYILLGQAQWTSNTLEDASHALAQGRKVGACLVLWRRLYKGTVHSVVREARISPWQSRFAGSGGINGNPPLLPDSFDYIEKPISNAYYSYLALFFVKKSQK